MIRFNSRVFKRYSNEELERCLREEGDLSRLLALGTIEYNKEVEEQNRAKELAGQRAYEEMQKMNAASRVYQRDGKDFRFRLIRGQLIILIIHLSIFSNHVSCA